jgi:hypothetical protein
MARLSPLRWKSKPAGLTISGSAFALLVFKPLIPLVLIPELTCSIVPFETILLPILTLLKLTPLPPIFMAVVLT